PAGLGASRPWPALAAALPGRVARRDRAADDHNLPGLQRRAPDGEAAAGARAGGEPGDGAPAAPGPGPALAAGAAGPPASEPTPPRSRHGATRPARCQSLRLV